MNGMEEPDELERTILLIYGPGVTETIKTQALAYLNSIKESPHAWVFCLEKLFKVPNRIEVKFFCLQVLLEVILHKFESLTSEQRGVLQKGFVRWLTVHLPAHHEDVVIRNKFAQILALFFKAQYPNEWPSFFTDMISYLRLGSPLIDMFLRVMKSIDDEVVSNEVPRNTTEVAQNVQIKDYMRIQAVKDITATWFTILSNYASLPIEISRDCLDVLKRFINWIDINLIANDQFLPLLFKFIANETLRENACECLYEIISKGMIDPVAKIALLARLNLAGVFAAVSMEDDVDFLIAVAKIVNTMGLELIDCLSRTSALATEGKPAAPEIIASAQDMLERSIMLMFRFLNNEDDGVSQSVFQFAIAYLNTMKNTTEITSKQSEHFAFMLQIIRNKMKYDESYNFDNQDENEAEFQEYRKELRNIYKIITKIVPNMVAQFVHATITAVASNPSALSYFDVEVALSLFYSMGDGIQDTTLKTLEGFFGKILSILATSNISSYPHNSVTIMYFEIVVRYARYIPNDLETQKSLLLSFVDVRGMRHANATVRSRASYLFQRFIKSQGSNLKPFVTSILQSVKDFLAISSDVQRVISIDDQINLYDAIGILVASVPEHGIFSGEICSPLLALAEEILTKELYKMDTPDKPIYTTYLIQIITAIGTFSKGFNSTLKESLGYFTKMLQLSVIILRALPNHEEIRAKIMFYMHRMIDCLGSEVLQFLSPIISQLMTNCGIKDLMEFVRLVNQLMARFKEQMFPVIDHLLLRLMERLFAFSAELTSQATANAVPTVKSEIEREILEIHKIYYLLISTVLSNNLSNVLRSSTNAPHLNQILKTIMQGCSEYRDMNVSKQCYIILKKFVEQWAGHDPTSIEGFNKFVYEEITPLLIKEVLNPKFSSADPAGSNAVLHEIVAIQKTIFAKCGNEFLLYLQNVFLPSLQCPPELIAQYLYNIEKESQKNFKTFFTTFVSSLQNNFKT